MLLHKASVEKCSVVSAKELKDLNIWAKVILKEGTLKNLPRKEQFLLLLNMPLFRDS